MTTNVVVRGHDASGATSDAHLVRLWLDGRPARTVGTYEAAIARFREFAADVALAGVTLALLQDFAAAMTALELAPASRRLYLSAVKSLLTFGSRLGYLPFNVGGALRLPAATAAGEERIIDRDDVWAMIAAEDDTRDQLILRTLYLCGLRVEELCGLSWAHVTARRLHRGRRLQLTILGKGGRVRSVLLPERLAQDLADWRARGVPAEWPVFRGRRGKRINQREVRRIVTAAARRVSIVEAASPHWLRHCHISHALDAGAPLHVIQATVGHASLATTGRYAHARPTDSSAAYLEPG